MNWKNALWLPAVAVVLLTGCGGGEADRDLDTSRPSDFGYQVSPKTVQLIEGRQAYERYCIGCHGVNGDGKGEAAHFLQPKPRDFTAAQFKFMSTRFGQLPTDQDLFRTITNGLRGSAMPSWAQLPVQTRWSLVAYIQSFSPDFEEIESSSIPRVTDPYAEMSDKSEAIARGEKAYHGFFTCWNCHPAYVPDEKINEYLVAMGGKAKERFRPNVHQSAPKLDSKGETIFAPDFLRDYVKSGTTVEDLYRTVGAGITGTAMPTWIDAVAPEYAPKDEQGNPVATQADIWAIAYYVQDLIKHRKVKFEPGAVAVRDNRKVRMTPSGMVYVAEVLPEAEPESGQADQEEFFEDDD